MAMSETAVSLPETEYSPAVEKMDALGQIVMENNTAGASIVILQKVQSAFGCVTPAMMSYIAALTDIPESELYGIATFYSQFRLQPPGRHLVKVCCGTACHLGGAEKIARAVEEATGAAEGQTSPDGLFSFERVACLGCCSLAPVMTVDDEVYGYNTAAGVGRIIGRKTKAAAGPDEASR